MSSAPWWKIGWRNLGRNFRRTLITALGLAVGYFSVMLLVGWADGLKAEMIENGTGLLSGQIQIHETGYLPERSLYDTIGRTDGADVAAILEKVREEPDVEAAAPRVYAGGLVSSGDSTSAGLLLGVDPELEPHVSRILGGVVEGRVPASGAKEMLLGREMARQLDAKLGDEMVVVAPAADGSMGNDLFTLVGVFRTGMNELDASYAILPLGSLQQLVALSPDRIHEIGIRTADPWLAPQSAEHITEALAPLGLDIDVEPWTKLRPDMLSYVQLLESWYFIVIAIVFVIAIFGVANTMLMATFERRREFAVMLALGTSPLSIVLVVVAEAVALGLISLLVGAAITFPILYWWQTAPPDLSFLYGDFTMFGALMRPVLRVELNLPVAWQAGLALLATALLAALYPAVHASRIPPADTLSGL